MRRPKRFVNRVAEPPALEATGFVNPPEPIAAQALVSKPPTPSRRLFWEKSRHLAHEKDLVWTHKR